MLFINRRQDCINRFDRSGAGVYCGWEGQDVSCETRLPRWKDPLGFCTLAMIGVQV